MTTNPKTASGNQAKEEIGKELKACRNCRYTGFSPAWYKNIEVCITCNRQLSNWKEAESSLTPINDKEEKEASTLNTEGRGGSPLKSHCLCQSCHSYLDKECPVKRLGEALEHALEVIG